MTDRKTRTLTIYRDDSTVQVVYERVKAVFWTANNTVLVQGSTTPMTTPSRAVYLNRKSMVYLIGQIGLVDDANDALSKEQNVGK